MGLNPFSSTAADSTDGSATKTWGEKFKWYLAIEFGVWLPVAYVACYRFQPSLVLMQSTAGRRFIERSSAFLLRHTPSWHASIAKLAGKIEGAPATRAAGEWALLNKVLAPVGFPTKMYIAHLIVQRRNAAATSGSVEATVVGAGIELASAASTPVGPRVEA